MQQLAASLTRSSDALLVWFFRGAGRIYFRCSILKERNLHRTSLGDFELTLVSDGGYYLDGGAMFGVVPKIMWSKRYPVDELNRIHLGLNTLVVRTGDHNVLIETGIGNKMPEKSVKIHGNEALMLSALEAAKISPDEIDVVINTHLHFDHCGWNTMRKGDQIVPTFPNAKYYVQSGEVDRAHEQHERDRVSYLTDNYDPLIRSGQMELIIGEREIVPGISVKLTPGHTRHHQTVVIRSGGHTASYIGDLIPTTAHLPPTWVMAYDLFPLDSIASRHKFYEEALPERWLCVFTHDYYLPWAYVEKDAEGKLSAKPVTEGVTV
jgi:glyoxylase-like metal-dependent hydrolase (beta-lactamase superfamily II)